VGILGPPLFREASPSCLVVMTGDLMLVGLLFAGSFFSNWVALRIFPYWFAEAWVRPFGLSFLWPGVFEVASATKS